MKKQEKYGKQDEMFYNKKKIFCTQIFSFSVCNMLLGLIMINNYIIFKTYCVFSLIEEF